MIAPDENKLRLLQLLMDHKADPTISARTGDIAGLTPLHLLATSCMDNNEIYIDILLSKNEDVVDTQGEQGNTPLMDIIDRIKKLSGTHDINIPNGIIAALLENMSRFLAHGASIKTIKNKAGESVYSKAQQIIEVQLKKKVLEILDKEIEGREGKFKQARIEIMLTVPNLPIPVDLWKIVANYEECNKV